MQRICATAVAVLVSAAALRAEPDDGSISKLIVGRWTTCIAGGSASEADGTICYDKGGTFVAEGVVGLGAGSKAEVRVEGTWKAEGGALLHTVTKSSHPGLAPVGGEVRERVLAIDGQAMRVKRGIGKERERKRLAE